MNRNEIKIAGAPRNDRPADRYRCGQLCHGGGIGNCPRGPGPNGTCGSNTDPCEPTKTFRAVRRRAILIFTCLAFLGGGTWLGIDSNGFLKPGDLSHSHAVIFAGQAGNNHCTACHPKAGLPVSQWFGSTADAHGRLTQTDNCVACHHVKMPADVARSPHNLSTERLTEIRNAWASATSSGNTKSAIWNHDGHPDTVVSLTGKSSPALDAIECASCHREHGGANAIMTAMSNAQCQSCHSRTFESFRDGHPDWQQWPHVGAKVIAFDHATHQRLHYPKAAPKSSPGNAADSPDTANSASDIIKSMSPAMGRSFDCRTCHPGTTANDDGQVGLAAFLGNNDSEPLRMIGYEIACADCHSASLREQATERLDLFAVPTMTNTAVADLGPWPAGATGFFDGEIGPLARWLVSEEPSTAKALAELPGAASITQVDPTNRE